jgi:hypothetical protein
MPKFVITYEYDGGYNASCMLIVNCLEYESLEKLKLDFEQFIRDNILDYSKPDEERRKRSLSGVFCGHSYWFDNFYKTEWETDKSNKNGWIGRLTKFTLQPPIILPLDEWFEYQKEHKLGY